MWGAGPVLLLAHVSTVVIAVLSQPRPSLALGWLTGPAPLWILHQAKLALPLREEFTPSLTLEKYGPTPHHRQASSHLGSTQELTLEWGTQMSRP